MHYDWFAYAIYLFFSVHFFLRRGSSFIYVYNASIYEHYAIILNIFIGIVILYIDWKSIDAQTNNRDPKLKSQAISNVQSIWALTWGYYDWFQSIATSYLRRMNGKCLQSQLVLPIETSSYGK